MNVLAKPRKPKPTIVGRQVNGMGIELADSRFTIWRSSKEAKRSRARRTDLGRDADKSGSLIKSTFMNSISTRVLLATVAILLVFTNALAQAKRDDLVAAFGNPISEDCVSNLKGEEFDTCELYRFNDNFRLQIFRNPSGEVQEVYLGISDDDKKPHYLTKTEITKFLEAIDRVRSLGPLLIKETGPKVFFRYPEYLSAYSSAYVLSKNRYFDGKQYLATGIRLVYPFVVSGEISRIEPTSMSGPTLKISRIFISDCSYLTKDADLKTGVHGSYNVIGPLNWSNDGCFDPASIPENERYPMTETGDSNGEIARLKASIVAEIIEDSFFLAGGSYVDQLIVKVERPNEGTEHSSFIRVFYISKKSNLDPDDLKKSAIWDLQLSRHPKCDIAIFELRAQWEQQLKDLNGGGMVIDGKHVQGMSGDGKPIPRIEKTDSAKKVQVPETTVLPCYVLNSDDMKPATN
jgi:hypothetical protein